MALILGCLCSHSRISFSISTVLPATTVSLGLFMQAISRLSDPASLSRLCGLCVMHSNGQHRRGVGLAAFHHEQSASTDEIDQAVKREDARQPHGCILSERVSHQASWFEAPVEEQGCETHFDRSQGQLVLRRAEGIGCARPHCGVTPSRLLVASRMDDRDQGWHS
ncbi:hypothetical protein L1887_45992 [Cichorium endivia]|nr:hypothetical protein L1887_45992 [Cichorium endivia]